MCMIFDDHRPSRAGLRRIAASVLLTGLILLSGCAAKPAAPEAEAVDMTPVVAQTEPPGTPPPTTTPKPTETVVPQKETPVVPTKEQPEKPKAAPVSAPEAVETSVPPEATTSAPANEELVRVKDYISTIYVDLKYATHDNFTGEIIYDFTDASLRYGTVKKLAEVQAELLERGYSLKIWDAYRPTSAQFRLWEICPDATYVANPNTGFSSHSRGNTIDVTLVRSDGSEVETPTGFDDFSTLADRDYSDVSGEAAKNAMLLEQAMASHGFMCYTMEWWHYSDSDSYSIVEGRFLSSQTAIFSIQRLLYAG